MRGWPAIQTASLGMVVKNMEQAAQEAVGEKSTTSAPGQPHSDGRELARGREGATKAPLCCVHRKRHLGTVSAVAMDCKWIVLLTTKKAHFVGMESDAAVLTAHRERKLDSNRTSRVEHSTGVARYGVLSCQLPYVCMYVWSSYIAEYGSTG